MIDQNKDRNGFVLVELLVVVGVLFVSLSLLGPGVLAAREASRRSQCKNNLKQIGLALHNYHDTYCMFPPGWIPEEPAKTSTAPSRWAWSVSVLPFIDQAPLYNALGVGDGTMVPPPPGSANDRIIPAYLCPSSALSCEELQHWRGKHPQHFADIGLP